LKQNSSKILIMAGIILVMGICALAGFVVLGTGIGAWLITGQNNQAVVSNPVSISTRPKPVAATFTATPSPTAIPTSTVTPTTTPTPLPSPTQTPTLPPPPPTDTPLPPTLTATPLPTLEPTPVPPTSTPPPVFPFTIAETAQFPTNHPNFDVYIAITDSNNQPLPGYIIKGTHSSGLQMDSRPSANDWTDNSGAMHYKAGNIKYEVPNSPTGVWTLQLVSDANEPAAPVVTLNFDAANPGWYFLIYRRESN
jgi:hypothetical protein